MNETQQPQSPFVTAPGGVPTSAAPATPTAPPASAAPPAPSIFVAPAQSAATASVGDTSYLDNLSIQEPLIKPCHVPCVITAFENKTAENGNPFVSITVQLYGDKMVFENGDPCPVGKRLTSSVFASSNSTEWLHLTGQELKGLILALHNIPIENLKQAQAAYVALPPAQKPLGPMQRGASLVFDMGCLEPTSQWVGVKAMAHIKIRKNKQTGDSRNEFSLLAAATKPVERKARS